MNWIYVENEHPAHKGLIFCYRGKGYPLFVGEWICGRGVVNIYTNESCDIIKYVVIDGLDD